MSFLLLAVLSAAGCSRDYVQASKSVQGMWNVVATESIYGDFVVSENGVVSVDETNRVSENGDLGTFDFGENEVTYSFTNTDSTYNGSESWTLSLEKVNQGFVKTNEWTLQIGTNDMYDVRFEDATKNAEKKAQSMLLENWPKTSGEGVAIILNLEKQ